MNNNEAFNLKKEITFLILIFIISRLIYIYYIGIEFDSWTLKIYWQFFPEHLLRQNLIESLFYNPYQPPFLNFITGIALKVSNNYYLLYIRLFYLISGLMSFILFFKTLIEIEMKRKISLYITIGLMILPTTILYENHFYKDYLTMCFLTYTVYFSIKIIKNSSNNFNYIFFSISIVLLTLLREIFHIFWIYIFLLFLLKINKEYKRIMISFLTISIFVLPFYLKNFFLYNKFGINLSMYENLSQKIEYVKQMQINNQHSKIKKIFFKNDDDFNKFTLSMSKIYYTPLNSLPSDYNKIINYKYGHTNSLTSNENYFNEIYIEVDEYRKDDFRKFIKEYPGLILISTSNSLFRHFFRSSDTFYFTRFNADKMQTLIKISHCIKITLACFYEFPFVKEKFQINEKFFFKINDNNFTYLDKIKFSLNDTNFILVLLYIMLTFFFFKSLLRRQNTKVNKLINFWVLSFLFIFFVLICFEDGEIPRHRFPFDYLSLIFLIYYGKYFLDKKKNNFL